MNLIIILAVLFAAMFLVVSLLEGRAQPLEPQQQAKLSKWITIAVAALLIIGLIKNL